MTKEITSETKSRMDKVVEDFKQKLASVRTGRASTSILDPLHVEYYGTMMPLNQVATVHAQDASMLTVQPFDQTMVNEIEKAIRASDLGLNPSNDGRLIRIPIPPLTEERRRQFVKSVSEMAEEHKTATRNIRRDANDRLKKMLKEKQISEDVEKGALDEVQKVTDLIIARIGEAAKHKEEEIMKV